VILPPSKFRIFFLFYFSFFLWDIFENAFPRARFTCQLRWTTSWREMADTLHGWERRLASLHCRIERSEAPRDGDMTNNTDRSADGALRSEISVAWLRHRLHSKIPGTGLEMSTLILSWALGPRFSTFL
jgi:hypothetical protein